MSADAKRDATQGLALKLEGIRKSFGDAEVLKGIDYDEEICSLAIIGPSGGGKSTLLRIIGGLLRPDSGTMGIKGTEIPFEENALMRYRRKIGFVFQDGALFSHMTALENIAVPLAQVHGMQAHAAEDLAHDLLGKLGLADEAGRVPAELSGGQRQRVAIARAMAPEPELLLLDEPTSALDPEYTTEILDVIKSLKDDGCRFIIVTHEMGFARHACDTIAFLYGGRILEHGSSDAVFTNPSTRELAHFLDRLLEWSV